MILKIYGNMPSDEVLKITVSNETKEIYGIEPQAIFNIKEKGEYYVEIEKEISKSNRKLQWLIVYFFTIVIQGIFNILLMNTDSKWYKNIKPYCLKSKVLIDIKGDTELCFTYVNSEYDEDADEWKLPVLKVKTFKNICLEYIANYTDFKNQYFNYVKKVISVAFVVTLILLVLLNSIVGKIDINAVMIVFLLLIFTTCLTLFLVLFEYKRYTKIYKKFVDMHKKRL